MHSDRDLELASSQLEKFHVNREAYHKTQADVLEKYAALMESYKRLRSDYEEERESREKYKQLAKGQERNPFVLVLIDGDGMVFDDELISNGAEGGRLTAQRLNEAIKNSLRSRGLDHCHVMVRVYANLTGLSKAVSKAKLCGADKRALAPFVASFNGSNGLFDFIDAGELKENADFKIRAMFRQFAENAQCKHIYFAACHDVGYISELTPFINNKDRITLVRTHNFHHEFGKLGLKAEELPHIFRNAPLPSEQQAYQYQRPDTITSPQTPYYHTSSSSIDHGSEKVCHFFNKGLCKYGRSCKNLHTKPPTNGNGYQPAPSDATDWRKDSRPTMPPFQTHEYMGVTGQQIPDFEFLLPKEDEIPIGKIPVNKSQQRLDFYVPRTSPEDHAAFVARVGHNKLCNNFHLKGDCPKRDRCEYDHNPITDGIRNDLISVARHIPCPRRGSCRLVGCTSGHVCQKTDCKHRGGKTYCKLPFTMHNQDLNVAGFVPGTKTYTKDAGEDENESMNGRSHSLDRRRTPGSEADSENEGGSAKHHHSKGDAD